jgi:hypothetical protein
MVSLTVESVYVWIALFVHIVVVAVTFGLVAEKPAYVDDLEFWLKVFVSVFLMIRFNPWTRHRAFTSFDRKVVFTAGTFIFTITIVNTYLLKYTSYFQSIIKTAAPQVTAGLLSPLEQLGSAASQ